MSEFDRVVELIQRPQVLAGMDRMQPEMRTLATELMDRFATLDQTPRASTDEGAAMALWGTDEDAEPFLAWHRAQGGLVRAFEVLVAAVGYERRAYEWDSSIWVLARTRPAAGLSNLGLAPWLWMRRAMDAATVEDRSAAREVARRHARAWHLRAALAFVFPDDDSLWTSDDAHELRHAEIYDYTAIRFGVLAAMRRAPDLDHAQLAQYFEISEAITPAQIVATLGTAAVAPLRLIKAYDALAALADPDAVRALLELSDAESAWPAILTLPPTAATIAALAPMFSTRRPRRVLGLQLARGFLAELVTAAPDEAAKVDDPLVRQLLADTGVALPADEQWVSPWAKPPKVKKPRAAKKSAGDPVEAEPAASREPIAFTDRIHWAPGERGNLANPNPDLPRERDDVIEKQAMAMAEADKAFMSQLSWVTDDTARRLWRAIVPQRWYGQADDVEQLLARFELSELDSLIAFVASKPDTLAGLARVESPKLAPLMARGFAVIKKLEKVGKAWLERFPEAAAIGLLGDTEADKKQRDANARALSHLATRAPQLVEGVIAKRGLAITLADLAKAAGPALPARAPKLADFVDVARLPRPIRLDRAAALQGAALEELVRLWMASLPGGHPTLDGIAARYTEESLAQTAWSVFRQWLFAGAPPKHKWAMYAVGRFPDDDNARALGKLAREWAPRGNSARAQEAVEVLAAMRTQAGLLEIYELSRKVQSRALRARAETVFETVAAALGLGPEELADRLVPEVSTDDLTFGEFRAVIDARLVPHLVDAGGAPVAQPAADDAARWRELEKTCKTVAKAQTARLERTMAEGHHMPYSHFSEIYMMHSLIKHLARSLVWGAYRDERLELAFSLSDDGPLDLAGSPRELALDARYGVVHPVELSDEDRAAWTQRLPAQPFEQLARSVFPAASGIEVSLVLAKLIGTLVPTGGLLELQRRGWRRGDSPQGGRYYTIERAGPGWSAEVAFSPGIYLGNPLEEAHQTIEGIAFHAEPPARPALFSEIQRDVLGLAR